MALRQIGSWSLECHTDQSRRRCPPPSPSPLLARCLLVWGGVWGVCIFRADPDCISGHASWNHAFHGRARGCRGAPVGTAARSGHVNPNLCLERDQLVSSRTSSGHGGAPCSGSCLRRWHCRTLAPKLSNVPLERQACSLWNPFHLCYSQTSETVLSASILLLYLTSISIRIKGSQSTTSRKTRVMGQETVLSTSALPPIYPPQQSFCTCSYHLLVTPLM